MAKEPNKVKYLRVPVSLLERLEALRMGHEGDNDVMCRAMLAGVERLETDREGA